MTGESPIVDTSRHHAARGDDGGSARCDSDRPQHPGRRHHDSRHRARRSAAAARSRATSAARVSCSSRRSSTADRATRCRPIEGLRLNNLCAQGAYCGVYWNDASFEEFSYVTGADSAEMGQGGMRVNMVPRDGGNPFHGQLFGNYAGENFTSDNCGPLASSTACAALHPLEPERQQDLQPEQHADQRRRRSRRSGTSTRRSAARSSRDKLWFNYTFRHWGIGKDQGRRVPRQEPVAVHLRPRHRRTPGIDDGHIVSNAARISWQVSGKDKISVYHDEQNKYRDHWGIASTIPPEPPAIQVTPTSFVNVTKWTRTQTNRLLLEGGFGYLQPGIHRALSAERDRPRGQGVGYRGDPQLEGLQRPRSVEQPQANAWNNPADHFSMLRTFMGAASYVTGSHSFRFGGSLTNGDWRLLTA